MNGRYEVLILEWPVAMVAISTSPPLSECLSLRYQPGIVLSARMVSLAVNIDGLLASRPGPLNARMVVSRRG